MIRVLPLLGKRSLTGPIGLGKLWTYRCIWHYGGPVGVGSFLRASYPCRAVRVLDFKKPQHADVLEAEVPRKGPPQQTFQARKRIVSDVVGVDTFVAKVLGRRCIDFERYRTPCASLRLSRASHWAYITLPPCEPLRRYTHRRDALEFVEASKQAP